MAKPQFVFGELDSRPNDSISCLSVDGDVNVPTRYLTVGCWDNSMSVYEIMGDNNVRNGFKRNAVMGRTPILCSDLDGQNAVFGDCEGNLISWNFSENNFSTIGKHQLGIRNVRILPSGNGSKIVVSSSWDKTVAFWDPRCNPSAPCSSYTCSDKIFGMDALGQYVVTGCSDRMIRIYDVVAGRALAEYPSLMAHQIRCIRMFKECDGFTVGSIEGRAAFEYFSEAESRMRNVKAVKSFSFRCHRLEDDVYPVNDLDINNRYGTIATVGGDGTLGIWDKINRTKPHTVDLCKKKSPLTAVKFSPDSQLLFFGASYDWSKGVKESQAKPYPNQVYIQVMQDSFIHPKLPVKSN